MEKQIFAPANGACMQQVNYMKFNWRLIMKFTDEEILKAYDMGVITISDSDDGPVCCIGLDKIWFGGMEAENLSAAEYTAAVPKKDLIREITEAINDLQDSMIDDNLVEIIWNNMEDIPFDEDEDGEMVLAEDYFIWKMRITREDIWHWFDSHFSKGVIALVF